MHTFEYRDDTLHCEQLAAPSLAEQFGTPLYVYSQQTLTDHIDRLRSAFRDVDPLICFSVKSCQNVHLCRLLREHGSGFDVVSGGELFRALQADADPAQIVFAGVGKTETEIAAALDARIGLFNIECEAEVELIGRLAHARGMIASAALRVNPDVDAHTHRYTTTGTKQSKFGVPFDDALALFQRHADTPGVRLRGLHVHIGSPVLDVAAYAQGVARILELLDQLRAAGFTLDTLDIGGGFGANYRGDESPAPEDYARAVVPLLRNRDLRVILEPGRFIAANAGIILTRVLYVKPGRDRQFVIVDASMNELIRPALYGAFHAVWPAVSARDALPFRPGEQPFPGSIACDVVGPVCESGDFFAQGRHLPPVKPGDLLAVFTTGAYGIVMASQYNSRPRAAEVFVSGDTARLIRRRETYEDLIAAERI